MENYRFIVSDSVMQEKVLAQLVEKKYQVTIDKEIPEAELNCFVIWADGTKNCIFGKCTKGDNVIRITDKNFDWFIKQI